MIHIDEQKAERLHIEICELLCLFLPSESESTINPISQWNELKV